MAKVSLSKLRKSKEMFENLKTIGAVTAGISLVGLMCTGGMGLHNKSMSNEIGEELQTRVAVMDEFENTIAEAKIEIQEAFAAGKLSLEDYRTEMDKLYAVGAAVKFAKAHGDEELRGLAGDYEEASGVAQRALGEGLETMAAFAAASSVCYGAGELLARKKEKEIKDCLTVEDEMEI